MKKINIGIFILLFMSLISFSACSDFLDVKSEGSPTMDNYFQSDQQAIDAIKALYSRFPQEAQFGRDLFWEQGGANDIVWGRPRSYNSLAFLTYSGDESPLRGNFEYFYMWMAQSNWVVKSLLDKQKTQELTDIETRSLGEAYFMRAFNHFYLAYRYGTKDQGVPAIQYEKLEGDYDYSIPPQQASVVDNYKMIIEDLQNAEKYLPVFESYGPEDRGRAHKAAAVGYMAKVYAYWATWDSSQWQNVITCVDKLENEYGRDLATSFSQLFSSDFADFWTKEYLWSIPGNGGAEGGGSEFPGVVLENKGWGIYNGWGQNKPSLDIYEEMLKDGEGNERLTRSILAYNQEFQFNGETRKFYSASDLDAGFMINKWMDPFKYANFTNEYVNSNADWPTARVNFHILRFADCLLLRAEAYLNTGNAAKATEDINRVRTRSHLAPLSGTATTADLYHERRCELAFEFTDHLYDCKRWAVSGDATIKALALKELTEAPRVRYYADRLDPESTFTVGKYSIFENMDKQWEDYKIVFPYPSEQINKSHGALKQNKGYD
jgi:hypothetical protein